MSLVLAWSRGLLRIMVSPEAPASVFLLVVGGLGGVELGVGRIAQGRGTKRGVPGSTAAASLVIGGSSVITGAG